jgi:hypothetical protein
MLFQAKQYDRQGLSAFEHFSADPNLFVPDHFLAIREIPRSLASLALCAGVSISPCRAQRTAPMTFADRRLL